MTGQSGSVNVVYTDEFGCKATQTITINPKLKVSIVQKSIGQNSVSFEWAGLAGLANASEYVVKEYVCIPGCTPPATITYALPNPLNSPSLISGKWVYTVSNLQPGTRVFIEVTPQDVVPFATPSCFTSSTFDLTSSLCSTPQIV